MNKILRRPVIAGNWKMNKNPKEAVQLVNAIIPLVKNAKCEVILCVPFVDLNSVIELTKNTNIKVGAQNCHFEKSGAFTGEISAQMLKSMGVDYVIIGHSERRTYFFESDEVVNKKVKAALDEGLKVILCVGEVLTQRENNMTNEIIALQIKGAFQGIKQEQLENIIIAYEPVWAIGTGKTATPAQAEAVCAWIRKVLSDMYSENEANKMVIQYGGSMNAKNVAELLSMENIDGGLIGGASLKATDFSEIVSAASE